MTNLVQTIGVTHEHLTQTLGLAQGKFSKNCAHGKFRVKHTWCNSWCYYGKLAGVKESKFSANLLALRRANLL